VRRPPPVAHGPHMWENLWTMLSTGTATEQRAILVLIL